MPTRDEVLHGPDTLDDAGVIRIPGSDRAIVQTVDFFPPIVDDPREFGRIAAANSLSDIFAMGGAPLSALNIVGFPADLPVSILGEILAGGAEKMQEAQCALLGGHSVRDAEIKYGLAVTGTINPDHMLTNGGAREGDVLILTKALGTGTVSTALNKSEVDPEIVAAASQSMATLNAAGANIALERGVQSATDVTGFGLSGHGSEMALASGVDLVISAGSLPLLPGVAELARSGFCSGGSVRNRQHLGEKLQVEDGLEESLVSLCLDSETSGGLLLAVNADQVDAVVADLKAAGVSEHAVIGEARAASATPTVHIRS
jgi:selenide,water dikinase